MKSRALIAGLLFLILSVGNLAAFGKKDTAEKPAPVNAEWYLCITAIDTSELPLSRRVMGEIISRNLADAVSKLEFRFRGEDESLYYQNNAWAKSRSDAAKALQAKRNERDLLLYRGDPAWKYRKNLKTVDAAISKLISDLAAIDAAAPEVEQKPVLRLTSAASSGNFPKAPEQGMEYLFCVNQKADAFLAGSLSEYHGRIYLTLKLYTLHTHSYSYEESLLFSTEDLFEAMDEIASSLAVAISETLPSAIVVSVSPPEAMVLIDGAFAVPGEMNFRSPGEAELSVRADNFLPLSFPVEMNTGMLAELFINLSPLSLSSFEASVPDKPGSKVYFGSLFVGETPLVLELPRSSYAYISVETDDGEIGSVVYRDSNLIKGSAQFTRIEEDGAIRSNTAFSTMVPVSPEEKRVDRARRGFYGAYGAFWFILPASLLTAGIAQNYVHANNMAALRGMYIDDYDKRKKIYDNAMLGRNVAIGAYSVMGVALGVTFFQIFRYLYVSGGDATPIVKHVPSQTETGQ